MNPILFLAAGFGILHIANGVVHRFEREAAEDLAGRVTGPSKVVTVRSKVGPEALFGEVESVTIEGSRFHSDRLPLVVEPNRSHRGVLKELDLHLKNFDLRALHAESLNAAIPDCRFDYAAAIGHHIFRLSESGVGPIEAAVTQESLQAFVSHKFPGIKDLRVRIDHDKVFLEGRAVLLVTPATFWIVASLEPDDTRLRLVHPRIFLNGKVIEAANAAKLADLFNPVLDLDKDLGLNGAVHVERLELRDGVMRAFGMVKIPAETVSER